MGFADVALRQTRISGCVEGVERAGGVQPMIGFPPATPNQAGPFDGYGAGPLPSWI